MQCIRNECRTARKEHTCDLCNGTIDVGSRYRYQFNKDGSDTWSFRSHLECDFLSRELWEFIAPWDGIYDTEYQEGLSIFCRRAVCPTCSQYVNDDGLMVCEEDEPYCQQKCIDVLQKFDFVSTKYGWKLTPKSVPVVSFE